MELRLLNILKGTSTIPFVIAVVSYVGIITLQIKNIWESNYRLQILSARLGLFLPTISFIVYLGLLVPEVVHGFEILLALIEAYAFYLILASILTLFGGSAEVTLRTIKDISQKPWFYFDFLEGFLPDDLTVIYRRLLYCLYHCMVTRTAIVTLQAICEYLHADIGAQILNAISAVLIASTFMTLLLFYEHIRLATVGTHLTGKFLVLKITIVLVVAQNGIVRAYNASPILQQVYYVEDLQTLNAVALLLELMLMAVPVMDIFSADIQPHLYHPHLMKQHPTHTLITGDQEEEDNSHIQGYCTHHTMKMNKETAVAAHVPSSSFASQYYPGRIHNNEDIEINMTISQFLYEILQINDIWALFTPSQVIAYNPDYTAPVVNPILRPKPLHIPTPTTISTSTSGQKKNKSTKQSKSVSSKSNTLYDL